MSSIIHKVKDAVSHKNKSTDQTTDSHDANTYESNQSSNHGPHDSNVTNTVDPRVDSDRSAHNTTGTSTSHPSTQPIGTGASHNTLESGRSSNHGPHDSNVANTADPRVDSDRSAYNTTSTGHSSQPLATGGSHNTLESGRSSNHGPHDSNIANTADPRIDSDRDSSVAYGAGSTGLNAGSTGLSSGSHAGSTGLNSNSTGLNTGSHTGSTGLNSGSHIGSTGLNSNSTGLNTSSHTGSHTSSTGLNSGSHIGSTGYDSATPLTGAGNSNHESGLSSNHGPHDSNIANSADPRVDSDRDSRGTYGSSTGLNSGTTGSHTGSSGLNSGSHIGSTGLNSNSTGLNTGSHTGSTGLNSGSHTGSHTGSTGYGSAAPLTGASHNANESSRSSNHGPHDSNIANAADPRVDSDRSKQHNFNDDVRKGSLAGDADMMHLSGNSGPDTTTRTFEEAHETGAQGVSHPSHTAHGAGSSYNRGSTHNSTAGPHDSNVSNKADPRVDSDLDGSNTVGGTQHQRI